VSSTYPSNQGDSQQHTSLIINVSCIYRPIQIQVWTNFLALFTTCTELRNVLFFWCRQWVVFFVCVWNISRSTQWICAKFTRKTCSIPAF